MKVEGSQVMMRSFCSEGGGGLSRDDAGEGVKIEIVGGRHL